MGKAGKGRGHRADVAAGGFLRAADVAAGGFLRAADVAAGRVLRFALPPACPVTGEAVMEPGTLAASVWADLRFITRPLCPVTGVPFESAGAGTLSALAVARPPAYGRARAALVYEGPAQRIVHLFKYGDRMDLAPLLVRWMRQAGAGLIDDADVIVPVPLHRRRLIGRRFNQAAVLAKGIAAASGVRFAPDVIERVRATKSQVGLGRAGRRRNVRGAFRLAVPPGALEGQRVLLVDDVLTSGATVQACARVLLRGGAACVDVLTLARVVGPLDATI